MRLALFALAALLCLPAAAQDGVCTDGAALFAGVAYPCDGVDVLGVVPGGPDGPLATTKVNDVWGWTDPGDGSEYALVGTTNGTVFVDVTVPQAPRVLGKLTTETVASTWRDVKVYADHAFVVSEASGHGLQVFDLTRLRGLSEDADRTFAADVVESSFGRSHNIVMDEGSARAYTVGNDVCAGLLAFDVSTPQSPQALGCIDQDGYTHDAQCLVYDGPDADYAGRQICFASNEDTVAILDVTDVASPTIIAQALYPDPVYTHQAWLGEDGRFLFVDDELDSSADGSRTIVLDVEDLDAPEFAFFHFGTEPTIDHNLYVRGDYAFQSNNEAGLRILDVSQAAGGSLTEIAFFDTYPASNEEAFNGSWSNYPYFASGTLIVTDRTGGLFTLRAQDLFPSAAEPRAADGAVLSVPSPNPTRRAATVELRVASPQAVTVEVYDATGRTVATLFSGAAVPGEPLALQFDGAHLPAGVYLVRATGETFERSQSVTVTR